MRIVLAVAALCAGAAIATLWTSAGLIAALIGAAAGLALLSPRVARAETTLERFAPLALLVFFLPVVTMPVAPGADMAMHVALARGLLEQRFSPAWPGVHPLAYPRGFSTLVAFLSFLGLARAGLAAAATAYVIFWAGLAEVLERLRVTAPRTVAVLCLFASPWPQQYFGWGGNATALALGLALLAAASLERPAQAALFLGGAAAVHPLGAAAGALVALAVAIRERRLSGGAAAAAAICAVALVLRLFGPTLSPGEARWIADYARGPEAISGWPLAGIAFAGALLGRWRRIGLALAGAALLLLAAPHLGIYAVRLAPIALVPLGLLLGAAPRPLWLAVAVAGLIVHVRGYQRARPMATWNDLAAIRCAEQLVPRDSAIDGAYGDATQWIPALIGRPITRAHVHVALFDETHLPERAAWRFTGERVRYGEPLPPPSGAALCRAGGASLVALPR